MRCPKCNSENSSVVDSRTDGVVTRRRRECQGCHFRFSTLERIEYSLPLIIKKDGRREPFDRDKLRAGLLRACEKRPVSIETIEQQIELLERKLQAMFLKEIESRQLGDLVMEILKTIDKIAYVRFASVYREFSDVSQFVDTLKSLDKRRKSRQRRQAHERNKED
ncbi:MAG: transcriptional regulator NrdR [Bdellovibrionota bacterium]